MNIPKEFFITPDSEVIFVADFFAEDLIGGAELTSEAIIKASPYKLFKLHSHSLTEQLVKKNKDKLWILFNWTAANQIGLISLVQNNCKFVVVEYDYKYCQYRSSHLHKLQTNKECNCELNGSGLFVSQFYAHSKHLFFMSKNQETEYKTRFPKTIFNSSVLSSVFEQKDIETFRNIRNSRTINNKWAILKGGSWIKNQRITEQYAKDNNIEYDLIGGLPYDQFLSELGKFKGLIFHPAGFDTCPRLVIEAKLIGLELDLNNNVQHKDELWFSQSLSDIENYLLNAPNRFWSAINSL